MALGGALGACGGGGHDGGTVQPEPQPARAVALEMSADAPANPRASVYEARSAYSRRQVRG
jgi:hypothetical protein